MGKTVKCKFPSKEKLGKAEAKAYADYLRRTEKAWITAYLCPAGDHWHVGHPVKRNGIRRKRKRW